MFHFIAMRGEKILVKSHLFGNEKYQQLIILKLFVENKITSPSSLRF